MRAVSALELRTFLSRRQLTSAQGSGRASGLGRCLPVLSQLAGGFFVVFQAWSDKISARICLTRQPGMDFGGKDGTTCAHRADRDRQGEGDRLPQCHQRIYFRARFARQGRPDVSMG